MPLQGQARPRYHISRRPDQVTGPVEASPAPPSHLGQLCKLASGQSHDTSLARLAPQGLGRGWDKGLSAEAQGHTDPPLPPTGPSRAAGEGAAQAQVSSLVMPLAPRGRQDLGFVGQMLN